VDHDAVATARRKVGELSLLHHPGRILLELWSIILPSMSDGVGHVGQCLGPPLIPKIGSSEKDGPNDDNDNKYYSCPKTLIISCHYWINYFVFVWAWVGYVGYVGRRTGRRTGCW